MKIPDPMHEQCANNERIDLSEGRYGVAAWYPSMGGYVSHCVIVPIPGETCLDVYLWHDGEFPFGASDDAQPVALHHCSPDTFIGFGELCNRVLDEFEEES